MSNSACSVSDGEPPVLTKQTPVSSGAESGSPASSSIPVASGASADPTPKTSTNASFAVQTITGTSNSSAPSSCKSSGADTRKAGNATSVAGSGNGSTVPASSSSAPHHATKTRRKLPSRAKKDGEDKNSNAGVQVVPQAPLMLTSAPPGQFMLIHHNGQCYMMSATQYFGNNQQIAAVRPVHSQQQYMQPGIVTSSATLGQLARSLAPKPTPSGSVSVAVNSTQLSSATTTVTATTTALTGRGSDTPPPRPTQQPAAQQLCAAPTQQLQQPLYPQGIQLRAPQGSSGIVFQMPSGAYTYVHQLVTPQQRSSTAVSQPQQIPACTGQATSQPQNQQQATATTPPAQKVTTPATIQPSGKQASQSPVKEAPSAEKNGGNASPTVAGDDQLLMQAASNSNQIPISVKGNEGPQKSVKGCGRHSSGGRKAANAALKIATPQPITPTNLVPVGAPVPMMVMSTSMPQISSFAGPAAVPFMGPNGQIIHQQLIANSPVPTHQMIPVFQQQQQSAAHFAVAQAQPASAPESEIQNSQKQPADDDDDNGFVDSGIENEPPPLLVQGESKDALDIHMMFTREAERYYQKAGRKGRIVHLIEGFEIEESDEPFPCEPPIRLSDWLSSEVEDKETTNSEEAAPVSSSKSVTSEKDAELPVETKSEKSEKAEMKKGRAKASPTKSEAASEKSEKKTRKRKTNELDRLLQMDFGPTQGRLSDILEKSLYKTAKENKEMPKSPVKSKGRASSSVEKQKVENVEAAEPVMERFIIEDVIESPLKEPPKNNEESPVTVDLSLNSSKSSGESALTGSLLASFSDEELDTERCNYCNGLLRLKRLENHPQYCSKKCRKLWKKNPALSEEQVVRSFNASPRLPAIRNMDISPISKEIISPTVPAQNLTVVSEPSPSGISNESQQRSPPTLTLKMVSPQQAEIVKSPRGVLGATCAQGAQGECSKTASTFASPANGPERLPTDFLSRATKTWTCDEVASWVASVTGSDDCASTFRNQDIDGQSLLLLPDNAHHNLITLLGLKLGPMVKILNALKELSAKSINAP